MQERFRMMWSFFFQGTTDYILEVIWIWDLSQKVVIVFSCNIETSSELEVTACFQRMQNSKKQTKSQ